MAAQAYWLHYLTAVVVILATTLVVLELRSRQFRSDTVSGRAARNFSFLASSLFVMFLLKQSAPWIAANTPSPASWHVPFAMELVACFVVAEGFGYFFHYVKHNNAFLWKFHFQHHREHHFSIWMVTHTHAFDVLIAGTITSVALAACGFGAKATQTYLLFYSLANLYQHSAFDYSLGVLDRIIVNPAYHRLHHEVNASTNYGNTLTLWDVVFQTANWPRSRRAPNVRLGLASDSPEPFGFVHEFVYFLKPDQNL